MAFHHGKECEVLVGSVDLTEYFRGSSVSGEKDTAETTAYRNDWKTHVAGTRQSTIDLDGLYDPTRSDDIYAHFDTDTAATATIGPAGLKAPDLARLITVHSTAWTESAPVGDVVAMQWSLMSTAEVFNGWALKDVETDITADGSGTVVDTGAAVTAASWCFHYHLLAIDAGTVVFIVQDSADGTTDWQPITSVTSGSLAAPTAGRVTGTGNVRRYIRVSSDLTTATSVTFGAAFARHA